MIQLLPGASSTVAALSAERVRLDVITQNIANANTTRGLDGKVYRRQEVCFESALSAVEGGDDRSGSGPRVSLIRKDMSPGRMVFQPGHPHADGNGMVEMPNVSIHEEMADMIVASRSFEANLAVLKNSRQLASMTLAIGKK
jgi:flagellar basal-body rod protein FlgC